MAKKTEQEPKARVRKEYAVKGTRSQKMMCFRVDLDNVEWLEAHENKGRYINELIARDRSSRR